MFALARGLIGAEGRRAFGRVLAICAGVSAAMGLLAFGLATGIEAFLPGPALLRDGLALLLPAAAGAAFYAWGVTRLGVGEFAAIARAAPQGRAGRDGAAPGCLNGTAGLTAAPAWRGGAVQRRRTLRMAIARKMTPAAITPARSRRATRSLQSSPHSALL